MIATRTENGRKCARCGRVTLPRGALPPRYCAICGQRLVALDYEVQQALTPPRTAATAIAALIFGLIGMVPVGGAPWAILAIILGLVARRRIGLSAGRLVGDGLAAAGIVLGALGAAISVLCLGMR